MGDNNWGRDIEDMFYKAYKKHKEDSLFDLVNKGFELEKYLEENEDKELSGEFLIKGAHYDAIDYIIHERITTMSIPEIKQYFTGLRTFLKVYDDEKEEVMDTVRFFENKYLVINDVLLHPFSDEKLDPLSEKKVQNATLPQKKQYLDRLKSIDHIYPDKESKEKIIKEVKNFKSKYLVLSKTTTQKHGGF